MVLLLNRAVAVAMVDGAAAGLALLDDLDRSWALLRRFPVRRAPADSPTAVLLCCASITLRNDSGTPGRLRQEAVILGGLV
ncbi:hypothetical protein [Streptomyces sp. NPDC093149]|uniref:hypothetical protein n=1 Tax=Streptomyces sp. NPDC093149 TaxID=3366031 RepID=UPI003816B6F1